MVDASLGTIQCLEEIVSVFSTMCEQQSLYLYSSFDIDFPLAPGAGVFQQRERPADFGDAGFVGKIFW